MDELMERLSAAASALERVAEQMAERQIALAAETEQSVGRIVATVESQREGELAERLRLTEGKLVTAETRIKELTAAAAVAAKASIKAEGRKTAPAGMTAMLSKSGISAGELESGRLEAGALDAALSSLSIEQRFAVKAEMLRSGLLG